MSQPQDKSAPPKNSQLTDTNRQTSDGIDCGNTFVTDMYKTAAQLNEHGLAKLPGNNKALWGGLQTTFQQHNAAQENEKKASIKSNAASAGLRSMLKRAKDQATDSEGNLLPKAFKDILAQINDMPAERKKEMLSHLGYSVKHLPIDHRINAFYGIFDQANGFNDYDLNFALACAVRSLPDEHKSQIKTLLLQNSGRQK